MVPNMSIDSTRARQVLARVDAAIPTVQWEPELVAAVQRLLGELYVVNPHDDVDGLMGPRTREAWRFFGDATHQSDADSIDRASAERLVQAADDPGALIGHARVSLPADFEFRRSRRAANRATSVAALIEAGKARQLTTAQIAYVLATAEHESDSFSTLEEYASGDGYEGRNDLGNSQPGDGRRFKGRGYVQLTGRRNYTIYAGITGFDLERLPIILMNWPALSVFVIIDGMLRGAYTGRRLNEFVNSGGHDFFNARRVINRLDRADKIAAQATEWLTELV
jgi:predicted chitinase